MTDESSQPFENYFTQFDILMTRRKKIARQMQRVPAKTNPATAIYAQDELLCKLNLVDAQCTSVAQQISTAGNFSTDKLTKYLAGVLTRETGVAWLPVRYLLRADSCRRPRVDAYGVIKADAIKTLPGITDTMTLLDRKYGLPPLYSWVKYRETDCEKAGCPKPDYETIENMDNIWMFTSNDFISVGANDDYNAFFDLNEVDDKPFLHLSVAKNRESSLRQMGKLQGLNCYPNYDAPELNENHPRNIALTALSALVSARAERILTQPTTQNSSTLTSQSTSKVDATNQTTSTLAQQVK